MHIVDKTPIVKIGGIDMSTQKPIGNVSFQEVVDFVKRSKEDIKYWYSSVEGKVVSKEQRIRVLNELAEIADELNWRFGGDKHVVFTFSTEKKTKYAFEVSEIIDTVRWKKRIWILDEVDPVLVMIDF